jgi:hypothetical protein
MKLMKQIKKMCQQFKNFILLLYVSLMTSPLLANLPKPPDKDIADGTNDWADVGGALIYKVISYSCVALGALILAGVAATVLKAFHTAHEKQDLGHFFKMLIVGLIAAAIGIGLVYGGYQIISQQG